MFQKKLKKSDLSDIITMLNYDTIRGAAKRLKVSPRTLQRYLKSSGCYVPKHYNPKPRIELNLDEIRRLRLEKMTYRRIAKRFNVAPVTIFRALHRENDDNFLLRELLDESYSIVIEEVNNAYS